MKLSISNLAWPVKCDAEALELLAGLGVQGVEVAPTRIAPWAELNSEVLDEYRRRVEGCGLQVSAVQSVLYGLDYQLLAGRWDREGFYDQMSRVADVAVCLGAGVAVFGSPQNRRLGGLSKKDAWLRGCDRVEELGNIFGDRGVVLGIEPVPPVYGGEFLTKWQDVLRMVREVWRSPWVRVHLDTACVGLGGGAIGDAIREVGDNLTHFHAAEPNLDGFSSPSGWHEEAAGALREIGYDRWISIEMREQPELGKVEEAVRFVQRVYGGV